MHTWFRNNVSGIDDENLNTYATDPCGNIQTRTESPQHPKERVHGHRRNIEDEEVDEELRRCSRHIRHKIDDEIETSDLDEHNRNIRCKLCERIRGGTIKSERLVFEKDWARRERVRQLSQRNEGVEQQRETAISRRQ